MMLLAITPPAKSTWRQPVRADSFNKAFSRVRPTALNRVKAMSSRLCPEAIKRKTWVSIPEKEKPSSLTKVVRGGVSRPQTLPVFQFRSGGKLKPIATDRSTNCPACRSRPDMPVSICKTSSSCRPTRIISEVPPEK